MKYDSIFRRAAVFNTLDRVLGLQQWQLIQPFTHSYHRPIFFSFRTTTNNNNASTTSNSTSAASPTPQTPKIEGTIQQDGIGISVGDYAQIKRSYTIEEVKRYGQLVGDSNPIHTHSNTNDKKSGGSNADVVVVHGMFTSALFSSIFGTLIPGSLYRSQNLSFVLPVYTGECIIGKVKVTQVKDLRKKGLLVSCDTFVYRCDIDDDKSENENQGKENDVGSQNNNGTTKLTECVKGSAEVWIPAKR